MIRISGRKLINILASGDETQEISSAFVSDYKQFDVKTPGNERRALLAPFEHYEYKKRD